MKAAKLKDDSGRSSRQFEHMKSIGI